MILNKMLKNHQIAEVTFGRPIRIMHDSIFREWYSVRLVPYENPRISRTKTILTEKYAPRCYFSAMEKYWYNCDGMVGIRFIDYFTTNCK